MDFSITKTTKGQYADYSTSKWARKESALTSTERAAIDAYGLFNLKDFLPKKPGETELKIIKEMFEASVDGQTYDPDRWSGFCKPAGMSSNNPDADDVPAPAPKAESRPVPSLMNMHGEHAKAETAPWEDDEPAASAPVVTETPKSSNPRAEEILAMIRQRKS